MNDVLILFDIDKTLIKKMVLKKNPWKITFKKVYGLDDSTGLDEIDAHGKTHKGLVIEALLKHNLTSEEINEKLDYCLQELAKVYDGILDKGEVIIFDKIPELLQTLSQKSFHLGLITGNARQIAFKKLQKGGIDTFFETGGFGEDSPSRESLVEFAIERAKEKFKIDFKKDNIFVVGDTPLDISSANYHFLKTIAVATGAYSKEDLEKAGATYTLDNLENIGGFVDIVSV